ncbi:MAG: FHA domain-containing protein [Candidatus Poribacteria bacterium]|nr:FHA domain-containing protein [Candidatus Poribacteria bacterium]
MPIICQATIDGQVCGYSNPDGLDFCDDCGSDLRNQVAADSNIIDAEVIDAEGGQAKLPPPPLPALSASTGGPETQISSQAMPEAVDPPVPAPATTPQSDTPTNGHGKLVVLRNGPVGKTYVLDVPEIRIGRWDADNGHFPEIDLTDDDLDSKISRSHAKITFENAQYVVEDLGSLNGTFINQGKRLVQGQKAPLNNGDELIVGKLFFRFEVGGTS